LRNFLPSQLPSWLRQLLRAPDIAHSREFDIRQWFGGDAIVNVNDLDEYRHSVHQKKVPVRRNVHSAFRAMETGNRSGVRKEPLGGGGKGSCDRE
jgi:hypothetical protein